MPRNYQCSDLYLNLPEHERAILHAHYSRMGSKGGRNISKDVRSRAAKKGYAKRMRTLIVNNSPAYRAPFAGPAANNLPPVHWQHD
jgi:hypothetical protein